MTSSARSNIDRGIVMPSALAVLRSMTRYNLVACSIGRSAGFAPFENPFHKIRRVTIDLARVIPVAN